MVRNADGSSTISGNSATDVIVDYYLDSDGGNFLHAIYLLYDSGVSSVPTTPSWGFAGAPSTSLSGDGPGSKTFSFTLDDNSYHLVRAVLVPHSGTINFELGCVVNPTANVDHDDLAFRAITST